MTITPKRLAPFAAIFFAIQTVLRLSLLARAFLDVDFTAADVAAVMALGLWFDLVTASFLLLPVILYVLLLPQSWQGGRFDRRFDKGLRLVYSFVLLFDAVAEHLFWSEFTTRFNFIAVDYLIYTQELIGNISESYPVGWLIGVTVLLAWLIARISYEYFPPATQGDAFRRRFASAAMSGALCFALYLASNSDQVQFKENAEATELAYNGIYNLFYAAWNNEISYDRFYAQADDESVYRTARALLWEKDQPFVHDDGKDLTRLIRMPGKEQHKNVILVVMESMSADYMGAFSSEAGLTPNLDRLAGEGLFFTDLYATGTRTVRGLEAVTLSIPPTPGQSIVRRPGNDKLFSLGFIFQDRGYDTTFIYGGYGYFDNMNAFFAGNGFKLLDRTDMRNDEIHFANIWGVCDEDMFARALKEADASFARGRPFMQLIMTTSNHRPYTYPEGRIDIASHTGRLGGVKYADYSIGKLVEDAKAKPWFKDTVFVFVADHTAGAGGKAELDPRKYHIPMIFYSPGFVTPRRLEPVASQIDLAPTLLGILNFSYYTKFYGEDVLLEKDEMPHAFISNFQKVGLVKDDELTVLAPKRKVEQYRWPHMSSYSDDKDREIGDAIAYYQSASRWKEQHKRIPTVADQDLALRN
jgi:phosphoglycerol transferase MdoB-like AlkP superfamily enzyme